MVMTESLGTILDTDSKLLVLVHCNFYQHGTDCKFYLEHCGAFMIEGHNFLNGVSHITKMATMPIYG